MMGNPNVKVFQVDWDTMRNAESTLRIFESALGHVSHVNAVGGQLPYVVVWLSFTAMVRENSPVMMEEASFLDKIAGYIVRIQQKVGIPVFVLLLADGKFHGSGADLMKPAMTIQEELTKNGILCSTNSMMWRGAYAFVGKTMYSWVKDANVRDRIWAHLDKHLFRQKMVLTCAMDWKVVPEMNGLDPEQVKRCTSVPTIQTVGTLYSMSQGDHQKGMEATGQPKCSHIQFGSYIPSPSASSDEYWVERAPMSGLECDQCQNFAVSSQDFWENEEGKKCCCNCNANATLRFSTVAEGLEGEKRGIQELKWLATLAAKLRYLCRRDP